MKDYELDKSKKGEFILNYKIIHNFQKFRNESIIINFANGEFITIPYTEKNERILIDNMTKQVKNAENFEVRCGVNIFFDYLLIGVGILGEIIVIASLLKGLQFSLFLQILAGLSAGVSIFTGIHLVNGYKKLKDLKKHEKFLELESILNDNVRRNVNMLHNTHKKTKEIVNNTPRDRVVFTINSVENIPFSDLDQMILNIQREDKFNFEYPEEVKKKGLAK